MTAVEICPEKFMAKKSEKDSEATKDIRLAATTRIWGFTMGILAICVPLSIPLRSSLIPLAAIGGATAGTIAVWRSDDKKSRNKLLQQQEVELLEQRLANLETIVGRDDLDLQMKIKRLESNNRNGHTLDDRKM
jgi:ribosomal protein S13